MGVWDRLYRTILNHLGEADRIRLGAVGTGLGECARPWRGRKDRLNPTDRGKQGSKRHLVVDGVGVPLAVRHTAANVHDSRMLEELVDAVVPIRQPKGSPGRPRKRPEKLHADRGYNFRRCRETLRQQGIKACISRCGIDTSERLGRHRWIVERTLAWLGRYRRLKVRYERRANIHQAFSWVCADLLELPTTVLLGTLNIRAKRYMMTSAHPRLVEGTVGILTWIVFGLIAGVIAKLLTPGRDPGGCIITMLLGVAGAFVGGFLYNQLTGRQALMQFDLGSLLVAVVGAVILLLIYRLLTGRA